MVEDREPDSAMSLRTLNPEVDMPPQPNRGPQPPLEAAEGAEGMESLGANGEKESGEGGWMTSMETIRESDLGLGIAQNPILSNEIQAESHGAKEDAKRKEVSEIFQEVVRKRQKLQLDEVDAATKENVLAIARVRSRKDFWVSDKRLPLVHVFFFFIICIHRYVCRWYSSKRRATNIVFLGFIVLGFIFIGFIFLGFL